MTKEQQDILIDHLIKARDGLQNAEIASLFDEKLRIRISDALKAVIRLGNFVDQHKIE